MKESEYVGLYLKLFSARFQHGQLGVLIVWVWLGLGGIAVSSLNMIEAPFSIVMICQAIFNSVVKVSATKFC